jgi:hypothetical protein
VDDPREVRTAHARLHQHARRKHHRVEALDLTAQGSGEGLDEQGCSLLDPSGIEKRGPRRSIGP